MAAVVEAPRPLARAAGGSAADHLTRRLEWPMALLALSIVPAILLEDSATSPTLVAVGRTLNWVIWLVFCAEYLARFAAAPRKRVFVRSAWFDLAIILVSPPFLVPESMQSLRGARALRLLRLVRAFGVAAIGLRHLSGALRHRHFHRVAVFAVLTVLGGAVAVYYVERTTGSVRSFGDSLWWAIVTATTVGYGDLSPATTAGRVIAVVLMLVGIGVIGAFTATVASWFIEQEREAPATAEHGNLHERLDAIEAKLDALLHRERPPG